MKRGDFVSVSFPGDYGKPRPALVIQADHFDTDSLTVLLVTSRLLPSPMLRIDIQPDEANGLLLPSQIMVDKAMTTRRDKVGGRIGTIDPATLAAVERNLALFLGFA
jgi:mRNA interferase MazF